jgi:hypothetical protein
MRRLQFSIKSLLWLMACVAFLCAGRALGIKQERARSLKEDEAARRKSGEATDRLQAALTKKLLHYGQQLDKETREYRIWQALQRIPRPPDNQTNGGEDAMPLKRRIAQGERPEDGESWAEWSRRQSKETLGPR